jgi:hypothetical protein
MILFYEKLIYRFNYIAVYVLDISFTVLIDL